jgi:hypothetical protein
MRTIQTQRGPLEIADTRADLNSWSLLQCLNWLARNDPNGEWSSIILCARLGVSRAIVDVDVVDVRDELWIQMSDA